MDEDSALWAVLMQQQAERMKLDPVAEVTQMAAREALDAVAVPLLVRAYADGHLRQPQRVEGLEIDASREVWSRGRPCRDIHVRRGDTLLASVRVVEATGEGFGILLNGAGLPEVEAIRHALAVLLRRGEQPPGITHPPAAGR